MPIYEYRKIGDTSGQSRFEVLQGVDESPLEHHPETGEPVERVISAPSLPLKYGQSAQQDKLSPKNLARHGFTRFEKEGKGRYVKTAGDGPLANFWVGQQND